MRTLTTYMPLAAALALATSSACVHAKNWPYRDDNGWPMTTWEARERLGCVDAERAARLSPDSASPRELRLAQLCMGQRVAYGDGVDVPPYPPTPPPPPPPTPPPVPRPSAVSTEQPPVDRVHE